MRLLIADDERIIRETIFHSIDWESMGIEVIGLCKDGIEAYNMILDEFPDVVLTDIRMPGVSGLELVREISAIDWQVQFIILSGYEEFEYAREAMRYGVKHYLLKPCEEEEMKSCILQAAKDAAAIKQQKEELIRQNKMLHSVRQESLYHLLMDGLAVDETENLLSSLRKQQEFYERYHEENQPQYYLNYIFYLEKEQLNGFLEKLKKWERTRNTPAILYGIYVQNTLLLLTYERIDAECLRRCAEQKAFQLEMKEEMYTDLLESLEQIIIKVKRYDEIFAIQGYKIIPIPNNQNILRHIKGVFDKIEKNEEVAKGIEEMCTMTAEATQLDFLKMLSNSVCVRLSELGVCSIPEEASFLKCVNQETEIERLRALTIDIMHRTRKELESGRQTYGILTERVMEYVEEHLKDSDLTLKKISEQYLYMNVDYVSKKFHKDTGKKFSQYLAERRVERAKALLVNGEGNKVQYIAEQVGCGNNPRYFTQIFKKSEGITPGRWVEKLRDNQKS